MTDAAVAEIRQQIMWNRLLAVVEEQAQTLLRTAFSSIVREAGDLSAGIFDAQGRMLAQAVTGTPGHVNSMAESVKHFIRHFGLENMKAGEAFLAAPAKLQTEAFGNAALFVVARDAGQLAALVETLEGSLTGGFYTDTRGWGRSVHAIQNLPLPSLQNTDSTMQAIVRAGSNANREHAA